MTIPHLACSRLRRLALAVALSCAALPAFAQWQGRGPEGGDIDQLLADPLVPGRVYASGHAGIFRSDDGGHHWTPMNATVSFSSRQYDLVADNDVPGRLYGMTWDGRLLRSDDAAESWTPTGFELDGLENYFFYSPMVLIDVPQNSTDLLLSLPQGYLLRSSDNGATFQQVFPPYAGALTAIAFDPAVPGNLLASTSGDTPPNYPLPLVVHATQGGQGDWTTQTPVGQYMSARDFQFLGGNRVAAVVQNDRIGISSDYGKTWAQRELQMPAARMARLPQTGTLVAMDQHQCVMSDTEFLSYVPCGSGLPATMTYFQSLAAVADGAQPRLLANIAGPGIYATTPGGTWQPSNDGLQAIAIRGFAVHPRDSRVLYAGRMAHTVSTDEPKFLRSSDRGENWSENLAQQTQYVRYIDVDPTTAANPATTTLYAAGFGRRSSPQPFNSGIYKSVDGGANWTALNQGLPPNTGPAGGVLMDSVRKVVADPRSCTNPPATGTCSQGPLQIVYALSTSNTDATWNVLRSNESGANWTGVGSGLPRYIQDAAGYESVWTIDLEFDANSNAIYVSTFGEWDNDDSATPRIPSIRNGVFRSDNRGASWAERSNGLPLVPGSATTHQNVMALATHPRKRGVLWASTALGDESARIYKSIDGGLNWAPAGETLAGCYVRDLQVDPAAPDVIYAAGGGVPVGSQSACLWRSENGGASWSSIGGDLPAGEVYQLRQDPQDRRRLLLATERGVWEALLPSDRIFSDSQG